MHTQTQKDTHTQRLTLRERDTHTQRLTLRERDTHTGRHRETYTQT